jgi:hypothetical protein
MILLISLLGRVSTVLYIIRQASETMLRLARRAHARLRRPDSRRRRVPGAAAIRRLIGGAGNDDDGAAPAYDAAWAT